MRGIEEAALNPLTWIFVLLAAAIVLWKWSRTARSLCFASLASLLVFGSWTVSQALLRTLENQFPDRAPDATPQAQAIVVLGGAVHFPSSRHPGSGLINPSDRVLHAFRLYRAGKAPVIVCSGGGPGGAEAPLMTGLLEEWGVPADAILLEERSLNTHENALYSFSLLQSRGIRQILLVTSASHMPRAAAVFRKVGFQVEPSPADYWTGWGDDTDAFNLLDWLPSPHPLMGSAMALREWVGLIVYRVRGWA